MARTNAQLLAFNRGEVSKQALARVDLAKLQLSAECQLNFEPMVIGPMRLRPGLEYIGEVLGDQAGRIMPFVFGKTDTALIELTPGFLRIWVGEALVTRVAVSTAVTDPNFAGSASWVTSDTTSGASVTIGAGVCTLTCIPVGGLARVKQHITVASGDYGREHGLRLVITNGPVTVRAGSSDGSSDLIAQTVLDTGTHALALTPNSDIYLQVESTDAWAKTLTSISIDAAGVLEIPTPWQSADLVSVRQTQSGDIVYVACYSATNSIAQYKIERRSTNGWSVVLYRSSNGPFQDTPGIEANFSPSAYYGNGELTSDRDYFQADHVGCLFQLFSNGQNYQTVLGEQNAFSPPVRVVGVGSTRNYQWDVSGTYVGVLTFQRSFDGPTSGFVDVKNESSGFVGTISSSTGGDGGTPDLDNAIAWERVGFKAGLLAAGAAAVAAGGSGGYAVDDILTVVGGEGTAATYQVASASGGAVETVTLVTSGAYTALPTNPAATTGGGGTGCTLTITPASGNYTSGTATVVSNYSGGGGFAVVRVTGYNSPTSVDIEILNQIPSLTATTSWLEQDWSAIVGYPSAVAFQEGRLVWTGRDSMWFSQSNNYVGYATQDLQGNALGDAGAILEPFGEGPVDRVNWILPLTRALFGREMSITSARSDYIDDPLTPTNFSVKDCTTQGAARLPALKIDKNGVYVQQSGRRVYELSWRNFNAEGLDYAAHDLTRLNLEIGKPGFTDAAAARQPDTVCYFPRSDGMAAALLYDEDDEVVAWYRIATLGIIENVCVLPAPSGPDDLVYFIVRRTVNGVTKRFIERLALRDNCIGGDINQLLDCHVVYQGAATTSITLSHLPDTTVAVWADGAFIGTGTTDGNGILSPLPDNQAHSNIVAGLTGAMETYSGAATKVFSGLDAYDGLPAEVFADQQPSGRMVRAGTFTVSGGAITLPANWQATSIVAFFGYFAPFMSAKLAYGAQMGSALTQKKKIDHIGLVMSDTHAQALQQGQRFDRLDAMPQIEDGAAVPDTTVWGEYDQPEIELSGEWTTDSRLCLLGLAPFPITIGGVVIAVATNEK